MEESDRESIREALVEMMRCDGWEFFRRCLLLRRQDQIARLLSILPAENCVPLYADARAKIQILDELLSYRASDILDLIPESNHE